jgi:predicted nucleic acid-binding protein
MQKPVYFDTSVFLAMAEKKNPNRSRIGMLLKDLQEQKIRIYTSIITVQECSVAFHRKGAVTKDVLGDLLKLARIYSITKDIALTAAKREAELKDLADEHESKRDKSKSLTREQEIEQKCENRRRKWDCFHIATAQVLGCSIMYCTDMKMQKRPHQLGIKNLEIVPPPETLRQVKGPLLDHLRNPVAD